LYQRFIHIEQKHALITLNWVIGGLGIAWIRELAAMPKNLS
jgi:hypothetical protein